jgi:hypothetical protein
LLVSKKEQVHSFRILKWSGGHIAAELPDDGHRILHAEALYGMLIDEVGLLTKQAFDRRNGLRYSETCSQSQRSKSAPTTQLQALSREKIKM